MGRVNAGQNRRKIGRNWELGQLGDGATRSRIEDGWQLGASKKKVKGKKKEN